MLLVLNLYQTFGCQLARKMVV